MVVVAMLAVTAVPLNEIFALPIYEVTIIFDANGGTGAPDSIIRNAVPEPGGEWTIYYDIPVEVPTRPGYEFTGWSVEGHDSLLQPGQFVPLLWDMNDYERPPSEVTFVAQWEQAYSELTFISSPSGASVVFIGAGA